MRTQSPNSNDSFTPDSQRRLLAYTTAASLGAFFAGQSAEGAVTSSDGLAPYPHNLVPGQGTGYYHNYFVFDVDGNGSADFLFGVNSRRIDVSGYGANNRVLNPAANGYVVPWTTGLTVDSSASAPTYHRWLANKSSVSAAYDFNNFSSSGAMGFQFVGVDTQVHFGYVDIQVNGAPGSFTATVQGMYWETTPNTGIQAGAVPEPSSLALLAAGISGLALRRQRRARGQ